MTSQGHSRSIDGRIMHACSVSERELVCDVLFLFSLYDGRLLSRSQSVGCGYTPSTADDEFVSIVRSINIKARPLPLLVLPHRHGSRVAIAYCSG